MALKALVVDDSAIYRRIVSQVLGEMPAIGDLSKASDGEEAWGLIRKEQFDVAFIDVEMPKLDGIGLLRRIKREYEDLDCVMISSVNASGIDKTLSAMEKGAVAFISKPSGGDFASSVAMLKAELKPVVSTLVNLQTARRVKKLASTPVSAPTAPTAPTVPTVPTVPTAPERQARVSSPRQNFWALAIGISTGGPEALSKILPKLPPDFPIPILIVQHMPKSFTEMFAKHMNDKCELTVVEAKSGDIPRAGYIHIAPGGMHMVVKRENGKPVIRLNDGPQENSVKPAVDVLFRSLAECGEARPVLTAVLTGMGYDGEKGLAVLKKKNLTYCISQSEQTCVVYGMPRAVDLAGLSDESIELEAIADRFTLLSNRKLVRS